VAVGRHEFQKGHRYLIEAMPAIRAELPEAVLLIVGRAGSVSNELSAAIERLGLGQSVHLLGHRQDVGDLLVAADVFIFPSLFEGFGGAMIEAMALGVPVVASDIPPLREVAGDGSVLFVPPASTEALAGGVIRILQDHGLAERLAGEARAVFQSRHTLAAVVNQMAGLYHQVAAAGPLGRPRNGGRI
jgi:glycosyltransferase involved in cell wall biosynthesis